jgi:methanol metabolism-related c-type cytochrome
VKPLTSASAIPVAVAVALSLGIARAPADGSGDPRAERDDNGKFYDKDETPTYKVQSDGTVDWYTYSGFRRYHSDCHVCHGPDGEGSTYAPGLKDALKSISYADFVGAVASGRKKVNTASENVMPAFGTNPNVMCYIDDIFIYLRARANDAVPRGRPAKRDEKSQAAEEAENRCLGPRR